VHYLQAIPTLKEEAEDSSEMSVIFIILLWCNTPKTHKMLSLLSFQPYYSKKKILFLCWTQSYLLEQHWLTVWKATTYRHTRTHTSMHAHTAFTIYVYLCTVLWPLIQIKLQHNSTHTETLHIVTMLLSYKWKRNESKTRNHGVFSFNPLKPTGNYMYHRFNNL
jgi:hypothetical protein